MTFTKVEDWVSRVAGSIRRTRIWDITKDSRVRQKSIRDIERQRDRILARLRGSNPIRARRVTETADRYADNIQKSRKWQSAFNAAVNEATGGAPLNQWNRPEAVTRGYGRADGVKVSRRTYMGLSDG